MYALCVCVCIMYVYIYIYNMCMIIHLYMYMWMLPLRRWSHIYEEGVMQCQKYARFFLRVHWSQVSSVWDWTKNDKDRSYNTHLPAPLPAPVELTPSWLDSLPDLNPLRQCTSRQQSTRCCSQSANKQMGHCGWHKEHCKPAFGCRGMFHDSWFFSNLMLDIARHTAFIGSSSLCCRDIIQYGKELSVIKCKCCKVQE